MLLSYSPEGAFVLTLFELVLSGLLLLVLAWIGVRERAERKGVAVTASTVGFVSLALSFATKALHCQFATCPPASASADATWLLIVDDVSMLLASIALSVGFLRQAGLGGRARILMAFALAIASVAAFQVRGELSVASSSIIPLSAARVAAGATALVAAALLRRARGTISLAALVLIGGANVMPLVAAWRPSATEAMWASAHVAMLAGLILLALTLEAETRQNTVRFFLRLNLTFLVLASSLVLIVTQIERAQFIEFSAVQLQDLAEFIRGHMLYYSHRREPARQTLAREDVMRKLVAEFGRYPDLRQVEVSLAGEAMALAINESGEIDQRLWTGERTLEPAVSPADFIVAPVVTIPILNGGLQIGRVQLRHSLARINEMIGWQMHVIFAVFTLFVVATSIVTGILVVAADRTIRRQYDELETTHRRLSLAERLASIGAVADGVAHEINNPAGVLVARTDYLLEIVEGTPLAANIRDDLDTIRRQAQRIARTVKDLLTFTRPVRLCQERVDVAAVVDSAIALVRPLTTGRKIVLERRLPSDLPFVCGDRNRLEQVFVNLLANAVQAIPGAGSVLVIGTESADRRLVTIVVRDTGSGIAPKHLGRIFDPFFTTKEPGTGTGLGLSIAYGIIRDHGGSIDVASTPGVGTDFRLTLPNDSIYAAEHMTPAQLVFAAGASGGPRGGPTREAPDA